MYRCRPNRHASYLIVSVTIFISVCWLYGHHGKKGVFIRHDREIEIRNGTRIIDTSAYTLDEKELDVDFPVSGESSWKTPRIPRIIHQTWKNEFVPFEFRTNIQSFVVRNPDYEYYFWTDASARKLISERHPYLLYGFDNYVQGIRRSDMLRYVVLYEYGGIYADLDTECLRSLDRVLDKYTCVITPEAYEQATLLFNTEFLITNSIMFCQAHHPFMKLVLTNLPRFYHFDKDLDSTGPLFLTYVLNLYIDDFKTRNLSDTHEHAVYVPSSQYFQNELDPAMFDTFRRKCSVFETLKPAQKKGCVSLLRRGMVQRNRSRFMITKHFFYHTIFNFIFKGTVHINELIKFARIY